MSFAEILKDVDGECHRRMAAKVPEWSGFDGLLFPTRLCTEQCSSSKTARMKAEIARNANPGGRLFVADLTGGIGVDSWAFGKVAERVLHNEMDSRLSQAAAHNFRILGADNILCSSILLTTENVSGILSGFALSCGSGADVETLCYLDPARRSASGSKVFRISDCTPDVLGLVPIILKHCRHILIKLSPMADIDLCIKELNSAAAAHRCREVHCIGADGECKELLVHIDGGYDGECITSVADGNFRMSFTRIEEDSATASYPSAAELAGGYLFEPGSALAKSGAFKLVSERFGLTKLGRSTQLYHRAGEPEGRLADAGRWFSVKEAAPFCNEQIRRLGKEHPSCEVSARNLPLKSDELRRKMKVGSGGNAHIFAVRADCREGTSRLLLVTEKQDL